MRDDRRPRARATATGRSCASRAGSTACRPPLEVSPRRDAARRPRACRADVRRAIRQAARNIARVAAPPDPEALGRSTVAPGVTVEQRVEPLARVGCYVPGGRFPLPSSLLMTAVPARVAGVARDRRRLSAAGAGRDGGRARGRRDAAVPRRRRARDRRARLRHGHRFRASTRSSGPATAGSRRPRRSSPATARSTSTPARPKSSSSPAAGRADWIAADLVAQAEHDPDARSIFITWSRRVRRARRRGRRRAGARDATSSSGRSPRNGAIIVTASPTRRSTLANRLAPEHLVVEREALTRGR